MYRSYNEQLWELELFSSEKRMLMGHLIALDNYLKGFYNEQRVGFLFQLEGSRLKLHEGRFRWILGNISAPKLLSSIGTGCSGKWLNHHSRGYWKDVSMWHLATQFNGGRHANFTVGLNGFGSLFQILWKLFLMKMKLGFCQVKGGITCNSNFLQKIFSVYM